MTAAQDPPTYEIRVRGRLNPGWAAWFDGLEVTGDDDGTSVLRGQIVDQSALHGLLQRLRDVGLVLEALAQVEPGPPPEPRPNGLPSTNTTTGATP